MFIEKSIDITISNIDAKHKQDLKSSIEEIIKSIHSSDDLDELNQKIILGLFKMIMLFIGEIPDNYHLKKLNKTSHYSLNKNRQIVYLQTDEQKVKMIINNATQYDSDDTQSHNEYHLIKKLNEDFRGNYSRFLDWYRMEHTEKYLSLFINS